MIGVPAIYAAQALASGLGVAYAWRVRVHRPIAILIALGFALDLAQEPLGSQPSGWRFALSLSLGSAYPWAVLGAVSVSLRGERRLGNEGRSHVGRSPPLRRGVGAQAAPGPADGIAQDGGGVGDCAEVVNEDTGDEVRRDDAEQAHREPPGAREERRQPEPGTPERGPESFAFRLRQGCPSAEVCILAGIALLFTLYLASLLSSGVRGPALARCYAAAQAGLGVGMAWVVRGWERRRKQLGGPSVSSGDESESTERHRDGSGVPRTHHRAPSAYASQARAKHATHRTPTATEIAAVICAAAEIANVPAALSLPSWLSARVVYFAAYLALSLVQLEALCRPLPRANSLGRASSS